MSDGETFLQAIIQSTSAKRVGHEYVGLCPAHHDHTPSLSIACDLGKNGMPLVVCRSGCCSEDVIAALRETGSWPDKEDSKQQFDFSMREWGKPVLLTDYTDASGAVLFKIARYERMNGVMKKTIRPWVKVGSRWELKGYDGAKPLLWLPNIIAKPASTVIVVEGEKCAVALREHIGERYCVTTWAGGSGAVNKTDWSTLKGRKVIIWPDADAAGAKAASEICSLLPLAAIVHLGERESGWDCADAILVDGWDQGEVENFIGEAVVPPRVDVKQDVKQHQIIEMPVELSFSGLLKKQMKDIMHYSKPWISEGVTLLAGRPKIGKTTLARQLAICLGEGKQFLDSDTKKSKVLFLSLEENERIFRRKLEMMGCPDTLEDCLVFFDWPRGKEGAALLGQYLDAHPDIEVIIIDSLTRIRDLPTADRNVFMQDYEAMRMFHTMLSSLTGKSLIMLHQTRKGKAEDPIEDISGSFGLTAACDSYFVFRTEKDGKYVLHCGGRLWDCDDSAFELSRLNGKWSLLSPISLSDLTGNGLTDEQKETIEYLTKTGGMSPSELGQALQISRTAAYYRLNGLIRKDKVKTVNGVYYAL